MTPTEHLAMGISLVALTVDTSRTVKSVRSSLKGFGLWAPATGGGCLDWGDGAQCV